MQAFKSKCTTLVCPLSIGNPQDRLPAARKDLYCTCTCHPQLESAFTVSVMHHIVEGNAHFLDHSSIIEWMQMLIERNNQMLLLRLILPNCTRVLDCACLDNEQQGKGGSILCL